MNKYNINDKFLRSCDKISLIKDCTDKIMKTYSWADENLLQVLIFDMYKKVVDKIDEKTYLQELQDIKNNNINLLEYIEQPKTKLRSYNPENPNEIIDI